MPSLAVRQLFHDTSPPACLYCTCTLILIWSKARIDMKQWPESLHVIRTSTTLINPNPWENCLPCSPTKRATLVIIAITRSTEVFYTQPSSRVLNHLKTSTNWWHTVCRIEPSTTQDQQDVHLISKEGKHIVLNRNCAFVITFFLSIILIIAHITYLFERLTFASDR